MSPGPPSSNPYEEVEVVIYNLSVEWVRLWNAGELDKVVDLYTSDALYLPAHHPPVHGRKNIREFLKRPMHQGASDFAMQIEFIQRAGELAYDVGFYSIHLPQADGSKQEDRGRYLVIWQRQPAGDWRILVFAAWSSLQPGKQYDL